MDSFLDLTTYKIPLPFLTVKVERRHNLQKATHAILGGELDISRNFTLNVEGYCKWFNQLSNINVTNYIMMILTPTPYR